MRKILKWFAIIAGGLIGVLVVLIAVLFFVGSNKVNRTYDVSATSLVVPTDAESIARGKHSVQAIWMCQECHGENLAGPNVEECKVRSCRGVEDDALFVKLMPRNLTSGLGGIGNVFTDDDYVRAIRHGIGSDGKSLIIIPSDKYNTISDQDLGEIIAYLKTLPPVDNELDESKLNPLGRIISVFEGSLVPASIIEHDAQRAPAPEAGVTAEYGQYLAGVCTVCHGDELLGGTVPGDEDGPEASDLTRSGAPGNWTASDFVTTIRSGNTPEGKLLDPEFMPWYRFNQMTDDELNALWLYLQSLPGE